MRIYEVTERTTAYNRRLAKKRVQCLNETGALQIVAFMLHWLDI